MLVTVVILVLVVFCFLAWVGTNVSKNSDDCSGIFGKIFGHKYLAAYDIKESCANPPIDIKIKNSDERLQDVLQKYRDVERTYKGHVCKRCGRKLDKAQDNNDIPTM